ncbi:hypothetical protein QBC36DRAFT_286066 [Triangularia setosa]|uniref:Uncharacterized protein n=1 Tax=Triangularia setosa TaxID=2587417 RepID=A0AAN7AA72_9PEZI|nr:hypothetical protein QBC36DRAFT_286066 [Podospora setosa]
MLVVHGKRLTVAALPLTSAVGVVKWQPIALHPPELTGTLTSDEKSYSLSDWLLKHGAQEEVMLLSASGSVNL